MGLRLRVGVRGGRRVKLGKVDNVSFVLICFDYFLFIVDYGFWILLLF